MSNNQEILDRLARGVRDMDEELTVAAAQEALQNNIGALQAINEGLVTGMNEAGSLYNAEEYFVPELLMCSDAMYAGMDILTPHIERSNQESKAKVVIGVIEGDTHDIGKNLVKLMLEVGGFETNAVSFDSIVNMKKAREGIKMGLMGNVSTQLLHTGERAKIMSITRTALNSEVDIVAPACGLSMATSISNLKTMTDYVKEGSYN